MTALETPGNNYRVHSGKCKATGTTIFRTWTHLENQASSKLPSWVQRMREGCEERWISPLSGLLGSLGQCPGNSAPLPTAGPVLLCDITGKGLASPGPEPFCTFLPSLIFIPTRSTTTHRFFFPKTFSNWPPPPSILLGHCRGLNHFTSFESLQSPNQSPQLQEGLYGMNTGSYCLNIQIYLFHPST